MSESKLQSDINADLRELGIKFYHVEKSPRNKQKTHRGGLPDLLIFASEGNCFFVELKMKGNKLSQEQEAFCVWSKQTGYNFYVVHDLFEWGLIKKIEELV